jgi:hypothetical protein
MERRIRETKAPVRCIEATQLRQDICETKNRKKDIRGIWGLQITDISSYRYIRVTEIRKRYTIIRTTEIINK